MRYKLDVHTHTIASGHAYSTIEEMARAAARKGLEILGITEHAPGIPGTCDPIYFRNLHVVPREMSGVRLLLGAELNILDVNGTLDLDEHYYRMLDLRIAGIHQLCYTPGTPEENTDGMMDFARRTLREKGLLPYYLYRQKNMAGNLENTGFARPGTEGLYNILIMEEVQTILALGAGATTKRVQGDLITRAENVKNVDTYIENIDEMLRRKETLFA